MKKEKVSPQEPAGFRNLSRETPSGNSKDVKVDCSGENQASEQRLSSGASLQPDSDNPEPPAGLIQQDAEPSECLQPASTVSGKHVSH